MVCAVTLCICLYMTCPYSLHIRLPIVAQGMCRNIYRYILIYIYIYMYIYIYIYSSPIYRYILTYVFKYILIYIYIYIYIRPLYIDIYLHIYLSIYWYIYIYIYIYVEFSSSSRWRSPAVQAFSAARGSGDALVRISPGKIDINRGMSKTKQNLSVCLSVPRYSYTGHSLDCWDSWADLREVFWGGFREVFAKLLANPMNQLIKTQKT